MKRVTLLLLLLLGSAFAVPALADDVFLLGFTGFDYEDPNTDVATLLAVGEGWKSVGFVTSFGSNLPLGVVDPSANEYTYYFFDLSVASRFFDGTNLEVGFQNPGRARFYEDSKSGGTAGTYGVNPPNATAPSTFTDGTVFLGGALSNFVLTYDFSLNQGSFSGNLDFDEGSDLNYIPPAQRMGWTLGGLAGRPNPTVPTGYIHQISGECRIPGPVPTTHKTWGSVKALYR